MLTGDIIVSCRRHGGNRAFAAKRFPDEPVPLPTARAWPDLLSPIPRQFSIHLGVRRIIRSTRLFAVPSDGARKLSRLTGPLSALCRGVWRMYRIQGGEATGARIPQANPVSRPATPGNSPDGTIQGMRSRDRG